MSAGLNDCGLCIGGSTGIFENEDEIFGQDCAGECFGSSVFDNCGVCDDDPLNDCVQDCNGEWGT
jgi:hypothetical protein